MLTGEVTSQNIHQEYWLVRGCVQGVGFRPFVYRLALRCGLTGQVWNDSDGVHIIAQGQPRQLERLKQQFYDGVPGSATIDQIQITEQPAHNRYCGFTIVSSVKGKVTTQVVPDLAVCDDCLEELFKPQNRRFRYPFINCTNCGPRFTIIKGLPYDRSQTSMAEFSLCTRCQTEYEAPDDRRFHAEPNACPVCGPEISLFDNTGQLLKSHDPIAQATQKILEGAIVAVKGTGGFQLFCDARNPHAVARLRQRKSRPHKPFAVMAPNLASTALWCNLTNSDRKLLHSPAAPIVLLNKNDQAAPLHGVAPGMDRLGIMLPNTPLHYLMFHSVCNTSTDDHWLSEAQRHLWVATSANLTGAPLVIDNRAAFARLAPIADYLLTHDRDILERCDDSVWQGGPAPVMVRRARGYAPASIKLAFNAPPTLACGAGLKSTVCLTQGDNAFLSQHIGDLDHPECRDAFEHTVDHLLRTFSVGPEKVICDLHPDLFSTRFAERFAEEYRIPLNHIQHHHAHIGAVLAEHQINPFASGQYLGVALDGVGLGEDQSPWGGELFGLVEGAITRLGHFQPLSLPGGDIAAREPWRMALAALARAPEISHYAEQFSNIPGFSIVQEMIKKRVNTPLTSSAGRWFDAVAGLLGNCHAMTYEGQAAMQMEALARRAEDHSDSGWQDGFILHQGVLDLTPSLSQLVGTARRAQAAWKWHQTLINALFHWVQWASATTGIRRVAFGGGCLLNQILRQGLKQRFENSGVEILLPQKVPANDGGISLGQVWVSHFQESAV